MRGKITGILVLATILACAAAKRGAAEERVAESTPRLTMIVVKDMHCASCAKKIAQKLYAVSGVLQVRADIKKNATYIAPRQTTAPSPRKMWEAVEAAGFQPIKLAGPAGIFTAKPKR